MGSCVKGISIMTRAALVALLVLHVSDGRVFLPAGEALREPPEVQLFRESTGQKVSVAATKHFMYPRSIHQLPYNQFLYVIG